MKHRVRKYACQLQVNESLDDDYSYAVMTNHASHMVHLLWNDNAPTNCLTTIHGPEREIYERHIKGNLVQLVHKPVATAAYPPGMDAVDIGDQMRSYYDIRIKSKRWYMHFYYYIIDTSICNAHVVYCIFKNEKMSLLKFRRILCHQLSATTHSKKKRTHLLASSSKNDSLESTRKKRKTLTFASSSSSSSSSSSAAAKSLSCGGHEVTFSKQKACVHCKKVWDADSGLKKKYSKLFKKGKGPAAQKLNREHCKRVRSGCSKCGALCRVYGQKGKDCIGEWHKAI